MPRVYTTHIIMTYFSGRERERREHTQETGSERPVHTVPHTTRDQRVSKTTERTVRAHQTQRRPCSLQHPTPHSRLCVRVRFSVLSCVVIRHYY